MIPSKAIVVARGFQKIHGRGYCKTYAPESKRTSIRFLIAAVAHLEVGLQQMDVVIAFIKGELDHDVYEQVPYGVTRIERQPTIYELIQVARRSNQVSGI